MRATSPRGAVKWRLHCRSVTYRNGAALHEANALLKLLDRSLALGELLNAVFARFCQGALKRSFVGFELCISAFQHDRIVRVFFLRQRNTLVRQATTTRSLASVLTCCTYRHFEEGLERGVLVVYVVFVLFVTCSQRHVTTPTDLADSTVRMLYLGRARPSIVSRRRPSRRALE